MALLMFRKVLANPNDVDEDLIRIWVTALQRAGIAAERVESIAEQLLLSETYFPVPATFVKLSTPQVDKDALVELVWQKVLGCVRRIGVYGSLTAADVGGDEAAVWAAKRMGWPEICGADPEKRAITRAGFVRLYHTALETGGTLARLEGLHELQNTGHGEIIDPALVGRSTPDALPSAVTAAPALQRPACPECGARSRHLLSCSALDHLDRKKALPETSGEFASVGAITQALTDREGDEG